MSAIRPLPPPGRSRNVRLPTLRKPETLRGPSASPAPPTPAPTFRRPGQCCDNPNPQEDGGQIICHNCNEIIANDIIVNDVSFGETPSGAAHVQGATVHDGQRYAKSMTVGGYRHGGHTAEENDAHRSRQAKEDMARLANSMNISRMLERAWALFELGRSLHWHRPTKEAISICLYIACRQTKGNTTLLIDFAEKINKNVFDLGAAYKKFSRALGLDRDHSDHIPLMEIEPLLYRFAKRLEFGAQTRQVANDAAAILARMDRDWMVTGRQPPALCGAALILAARMNNFRRTVREVVYVVKAGDGTIVKRLNEFRETRAGNLTVAQFREFGKRLNSNGEMPPVVRRTKEKLLEAAVRAAEEAGVEMISGQAYPIISTQRDDDGFALPNLPASATKARGRPPKNQQNARRPAPGPGATTSSPIVINDNSDSDDESTETAQPSSSVVPSETPNASTPNPKKRKAKAPAPEPFVITEADLAGENELERAIVHVVEEHINDAKYNTSLAIARAISNAEKERERRYRETLQAPYLRTWQQSRRTGVPEAENGDGESQSEAASEVVVVDECDPLDAMFIDPGEFDDDPEVVDCKLTDEEIAARERVWVTNNADWLRRQLELQLNKEMELAKKGKHASRPSRSGNQNDDEASAGSSEEAQAASIRREKAKRQRLQDLEKSRGRINSAADATMWMLHKKAGSSGMRRGFSSHVDYGVLREVYSSGSARHGSADTASTGARSRTGTPNSSATGATFRSALETPGASSAAATPTSDVLLDAELLISAARQREAERARAGGREVQRADREAEAEDGGEAGVEDEEDEDEEDEEQEDGGFQEDYDDEDLDDNGSADNVDYDEVGLAETFEGEDGYE